MSAINLIEWLTDLGAALGGYLGSRYGLVATFWTAAALSAICIPLVYFGVTEQGLTVSPDTE